MPQLIKQENGQDGNNNAEPCQRQAIKTNPVSVNATVVIEPALFLVAIGVRDAGKIGVTDVSKRMRRLKDRDERQRHH